MGATAMIASTALQAGGKIQAGHMAQQSDNYAAEVLHQEAGASVASGIQGAINDTRQARYVASRAIATAAGTGGGGSDPTVNNIIANINSQGEYKALTSIYQGRDRASEISSRAAQLTYEGKASDTAGWMSGISSVLTGGQSFMSKYGQDGPPDPSQWGMGPRE